MIRDTETRLRHLQVGAARVRCRTDWPLSSVRYRDGRASLEGSAVDRLRESYIDALSTEFGDALAAFPSSWSRLA